MARACINCGEMTKRAGRKFCSQACYREYGLKPKSEKTCNRCGVVKSAEEFYVLKSGSLQSECKQCTGERSQTYYSKNRLDRLAYSRKWWGSVGEQQNQKQKNRNREIRLRVLKAYGGEIPKCACCDEPRLEFLAMDHLNGDGAKHRRDMKENGEGNNIYRWLEKNKHPAGFRILCHNCNMSRGCYGYCPHERGN